MVKTYRSGKVKVHAVRGVDLTVNAHETVVIMGPSGCGKSTLLHLMAGLDKPTFGSVIVNGKDITKMDDKQLTEFRRNQLGIVFQFFNLIPTLTALENIELPMLSGDLTPTQRKKKCFKLLETVGLLNKANRKPNQLSGGEQQRIAIARALVNEPLIVLMDEPTGNLDSKTAEDVLSLIKNLKEKGKSFIIATHDRTLTRIADRVVFIRDGNVIDDMLAIEV